MKNSLNPSITHLVLKEIKQSIGMFKYYIAQDPAAVMPPLFRVKDFLPGKEVFSLNACDYIIIPPKFNYEVHPEMYGGTNREVYRSHKGTDSYYFNLIKDNINIPKIGICYGSLILAAASGATFYSIEGEEYMNNTSEVYVKNRTLNFLHTKVKNINISNLTNKDAIPLGISRKNSTTINEIIHFKNTNSLCLQFRPDKVSTKTEKNNKQLFNIIQAFIR